MSTKKGFCSTCGWYATAEGYCKYNVMDRERGCKSHCGWWKPRKKRKAVGA